MEEKMKEYYKKKMEYARQQMACLCENPVENSWRGMQEALAFVQKNGTPNDISNAKLISDMWSHFNCELMTLEENEKNN
jgi:hypothetical protein